MGRDFLGTGWAFPLRVTPRGGFRYVSADADVAQAIWLILATAPGERPMRPRFGCGIRNFVFAPNNPGTRAGIAQQVRQALLEWEPRIELLSVDVDAPPESPELLLIRVHYRILANNAFHNLVYPFYLREGRGT